MYSKACKHGKRPQKLCAKCTTEAHTASGRKWRAKHPAYMRTYGRTRDRRLTRYSPEYRAKKRKWNRKAAGAINPSGKTKTGKCPICHKGPIKLVYDHSHKTGKFRGWLCSSCNAHLGWYEKWAKLVRKYLTGSRP